MSEVFDKSLEVPEEDDRKIVIYDTEWSSMNVFDKEVIQPVDLSKKILPLEDVSELLSEQLEDTPVTGDIVLLKTHQAWLVNKDGELGTLVYEAAYARKLDEEEKGNFHSTFLSEGSTVGQVEKLFQVGEDFNAPGS